MAIQFGSPKIVKELSFKKEAKDGLISGINKLAEAVGSTLGASGRTVVLEDDFGNPHVTKDGVTVANYINLEDPVENLGVTQVSFKRNFYHLNKHLDKQHRKLVTEQQPQRY